jgi:hemerythrin
MAAAGPPEPRALNHDEIDRQHTLQLDLLRALAEAVDAGSERRLLDEILDRLVDFTDIHFASEQMLMRLYSYPDFQVHLQQHEETLERIAGLRRRLDDGGGGIDRRAIETLSAWIVDHIRYADRIFAQYLNSLHGSVVARQH